MLASAVFGEPLVSPEKPGRVARNCLLLPETITVAVASLQYQDFLDTWDQASALCTAAVLQQESDVSADDFAP